MQKSKDTVLLEQAYGEVEKQSTMSHMLAIAENLFEIGSRIKSKSVTVADAEYLIDASVEIEDIYNKYLSV